MEPPLHARHCAKCLISFYPHSSSLRWVVPLFLSYKEGSGHREELNVLPVVVQPTSRGSQDVKPGQSNSRAHALFIMLGSFVYPFHVYICTHVDGE